MRMKKQLDIELLHFESYHTCANVEDVFVIFTFHPNGILNYSSKISIYTAFLLFHSHYGMVSYRETYNVHFHNSETKML
jgi:hypothetical protein